MPTPSELLLAGVNTDIKQMDAGALAALKPAMALARKEVESDLQRWLQQLGPNAATMKYSAAHLKQVQVLLGVAQATGSAQRRSQTSLPVIASRAVLDVMGQQQAPQRALATLNNQLDTLRTHFKDIPQMQLVTAAQIAKGDRLAMDRYRTSAARYSGQVRDDLRMQFAVGLSKGESIQDLVTRISKVSSFKGAVDANHPAYAAKAMAGGLTDRYQNWAQRLVRTELVNAYNVTALEGIKSAHRHDSQIVARWDASRDLRVCVTCSRLDGATVKPGANFSSGYPHPPAHPNCRCAITTWMAEWDDSAVGNDVPMPPSAEELDASRAKEARAKNEAARAQEAAVVQSQQAPEPRRRDRRPARPEVDWGAPWDTRTQTHMDFASMLQGLDPRDQEDMLRQLRQFPKQTSFGGGVKNQSLIDFVENQRRVNLELRQVREWDERYNPAVRAQVREARRRERQLAVEERARTRQLAKEQREMKRAVAAARRREARRTR